MAAPSIVSCEIHASVPTGLEEASIGEVREKLNTECVMDRGKVTFDIPIDSVSKCFTLSSVDNLLVNASTFEDFQFDEAKEKALQQLEDLTEQINWHIGLEAWHRVTSFHCKVSSDPQPDYRERREQSRQKAGNTSNGVTESTKTSENGDIAEPAEKKSRVLDPDKPAFRVTCYRTGTHSFQSPDAARHFGGAVQDYFGWNVSMKHYDIEVVLDITNSQVQVGISLTRESLHKRNIAHFGITTLRPTIAYNMLRFCNIQPGDVVCDPMCGGGTIPIEAALNWKSSYTLCGDVQDINGVAKAKLNFEYVCSKRSLRLASDVILWDVTHMPLQDNTVDVFITDLPFGKRSGTKLRNWHLYPRALREMARVCRPHARAALLTQDRKCMIKVLNGMNPLWKAAGTKTINIGGLSAGVFLLRRTATAAAEVAPYDPSQPGPRPHTQGATPSQPGPGPHLQGAPEKLTPSNKPGPKPHLQGAQKK